MDTVVKDGVRGYCPLCGNFLMASYDARGCFGYLTVEDYVSDHPSWGPYSVKNGVRIPWKVCSICGHSTEKAVESGKEQPSERTGYS